MTDSLRIPVGPGALYVERYGFGDRPVVLLHGFGTSAFLWRAVAPLLPLGKVTAYAIDLFGYGESDRSLDADYSIDAQVEYLDRALTVLRVARADVVGIDFGAAVALALAARRPARVRTMVLINPADPARLRGSDLSELQRLAARHLLDSERGMLGATALLGPILEQGVATAERMPAALVGRYVAPYVGRDGVRHLLQLERAINDRAMERVEWEKIAQPVLVVRGDQDGWVSPDVAAALATRFVRGEHRRMSGAVRLVPEDAPDALAEVLSAWIIREFPLS